MNTLAPNQKLGFGEKFAYGFGDLASCIYWTTFSNFLLIFYTDVFGLEGKVAGTILLLSRIWDGVNDPIIGAIADRTQTRWGRFRPYLLWMCVPFAVAGVLCFTTPDLGTAGKLIWAWVTYNVLMMLYTAINIPYNSMLGVISADPIERTVVSSFKFFFAFGAGFLVKGTLPFLTRWFGEGGTNLQRGYQLTFVLYGALAVVFFLITFLFTRERVSPPKSQRTPWGRDVLDLVTNTPWLILLGTTITFIMFVASRDSITAHYVKYFLGEQELTLPVLGTRKFGYEAFVTAFLVIGAIGSILGVLVVSWFAELVGKKTAFTILLLVSVIVTASYYFLGANQLVLIFGLQFIASVTGGPMSVLLWAMYADTADYGEWKKGRRATGLVFSASTMSQKFGWAICGWAAGNMLSVTGFVPNAITQTPETLHGMIVMMSVAPALAGVVAIIIVLFFPLNEPRMAEIEAALKQRRAVADPEARAADLRSPEMRRGQSFGWGTLCVMGAIIGEVLWYNIADPFNSGSSLVGAATIAGVVHGTTVVLLLASIWLMIRSYRLGKPCESFPTPT